MHNNLNSKQSVYQIKIQIIINIMKKVIICAMAFVTLLAFSACNKEKEVVYEPENIVCEPEEGVYEPDKKISKVYSSDKSAYIIDGELYIQESQKHLNWQWHWDEGKVSSMDYWSSDSIVETLRFEYNGNRLVKAYVDNGDYYVVFSYTGNKLSKIEYYDNDALETESEVTHSGGKITEISRVSYQYASRNTKNVRWDGDNIFMTMVMKEEGYPYTEIYEYDNKKNPYYAFYGAYVDEGDLYDFLPFICSKNNVISVKDKNGNDTYTYTYKYDGEWPIEQTYFKKLNESGSEYYSYTYYYEYE